VVATSTTTWIGERRPCLTYGTRGMINLSVRVQGPLQVGALAVRVCVCVCVCVYVCVRVCVCVCVCVCSH
jgi:hypothetical protein